MPTTQRSSHAVALRFALGVSAVASVVPVWAHWAFSSWEGWGLPTVFLMMLWSALENYPKLSHHEFWYQYYGPQFAAMAAVVLIGYCVGYIGCGIARRGNRTGDCG